jgi:RHS repeat-associated protein
MAERLAGAGGSVRFSEYVVAGGDTVAVRNSGSDGSVRLRWQHKDHLGSVVALTDETGAVAERLSFDAWGKRRNPNGSDDPAGALTSQATRGFTGHEMLDDVDLVHMNGRVYDPITARFTSADPFVKHARLGLRIVVPHCLPAAAIVHGLRGITLQGVVIAEGERHGSGRVA